MDYAAGAQIVVGRLASNDPTAEQGASADALGFARSPLSFKPFGDTRET